MFYLRKLEISEVFEFSILALTLNRKLGKLGNIFKTCEFQKTFLFEEVGNFRNFRVFHFGPYTEIENSENSKLFSRLVNFKGCVLLEEVGNFRNFRVFHFRPYTEIENSENSEILC